MNEPLVLVTAGFDVAYGNWKQFESAKNAAKNDFFELADKELAKDSVAERLIEVTLEEGEEETGLLARVRRFNPGWKIDEYRSQEGVYEFIMIEDITLKSFTYVNKQIERVFKRTVSSGSPMLDEEYMQLADPDLYEEIAFPLPWGERIIPPLNTLNKDLISRIQPFVYNGPPRVSMAAPRDAKPEELE